MTHRASHGGAPVSPWRLQPSAVSTRCVRPGMLQRRVCVYPVWDTARLGSTVRFSGKRAEFSGNVYFSGTAGDTKATVRSRDTGDKLSRVPERGLGRKLDTILRDRGHVCCQIKQPARHSDNFAPARQVFDLQLRVITYPGSTTHTLAQRGYGALSCQAAREGVYQRGSSPIQPSSSSSDGSRSHLTALATSTSVTAGRTLTPPRRKMPEV